MSAALSFEKRGHFISKFFYLNTKFVSKKILACYVLEGVVINGLRKCRGYELSLIHI